MIVVDVLGSEPRPLTGSIAKDDPKGGLKKGSHDSKVGVGSVCWQILRKIYTIFRVKAIKQHRP